MRSQEIVDEGGDLLRVEFGGGVRIEHGRVVDVVTLAGEGGLDGRGSGG